MWFPVDRDNPDAIDTPFSSRRQGLLEELAGFTVSPEVFICGDTRNIYPISESDDIPKEEMSGLNSDLEYILVRAKLQPANDRCFFDVAAGSVEDIFYDQMLERARH